MRSILVGVVMVMVAVGSPAYGGGIDDHAPRPRVATEPEEVAPAVGEERTIVHQRAPFREVVVEDYHSAGAEWGMGVASTILSVFYTPVRLTVGVVGAGLGGVEGLLTGGNLRTARSMWRPTVEGDYFIRPDHLDRTEHYEFGNFRPIAQERYTLHGREVVVREEEAVAAVPLESGSRSVDAEVAPIEPELEDAGDDR
jgi:hypothetical protein